MHHPPAGGHPPPPAPTSKDLATVIATITATAHPTTDDDGSAGPVDLLDALTLLRWAQTELARLEPILITAARNNGISWQALAPALGVASRQAAERRYLRNTTPTTTHPGTTQDDRVQAERNRRATHRAITQWANNNTADLRRLAGQITALTDLDDTATPTLNRLHQALADPDASALPALLAATYPHLPHHPDLAAQINTITTHTNQLHQQHPPRDGTS
jgi:hypothetical protein